MSFGSFRRINSGIVSSCVVGLALSYYAYGVETSKERDHTYEAMCDISEHVSCTKAFMSEYGKGFGIIPRSSALYFPNSVYGMMTYSSIALLSTSDTYIATLLLVILGILSNLGSVYLSLVLYVLRDICVICIGTYLVNAVNLILVIKKFGTLSICVGSLRNQKSN